MPVHATGSVAIAKPELGRAITEFDPASQGYIGNQVYPPIPVNKEEGKIRMVCREEMGQLESTQINAGAVYPRGSYSTELIEYACKKYGFEVQVTDEDYAIYRDTFDAEVVAAKRARGAVVVEEESDVKDATFDATNWTGAALYTDNSGAPWDNIASDIIGQVNAAIENVITNSGAQPNALVVGRGTVNNMLLNTAILARFPGAAAVTRKMVRDHLLSLFDGLDTIIEGRAVYNSAKEGQSWVGSSIWPDDYAMVCKVATSNDPSEPCIGRSLVWDAVDGQNGVEYATEMYREEQTESNILRVKKYREVKRIDTAFGHLMKIDA